MLEKLVMEPLMSTPAICAFRRAYIDAKRLHGARFYTESSHAANKTLSILSRVLKSFHAHAPVMCVGGIAPRTFHDFQ